MIRLRQHFITSAIGWTTALTLLLLLGSIAVAENTDVIKSEYAQRDVALENNPSSPFWQNAPPVFAEHDSFGKPAPAYRTEIRSRWTNNNLYLLFICPYQELYLKPVPDPVHETNQLWNWDVAEAFIGSEFRNIKHYKEFEMSPQGEWIDLDIHLEQPHHENGWVWNSGFEVSARIDEAAHVWYGAMRIPMKAIDSRPAAPGNTFRVNFFRSQGPPPHRQEVAWQPPMTNTFHTPERFGLLKLTK